MRSESGHPIVAAILDYAMLPMQPLRHRVVPRASGRVLEIGVGTGLNADLYDASKVLSLVGIEPDPHMLRRARPRFDAAECPVELVQVGAEAMPFEDASFDAIVLTFTLCTIPDVEAAVREMHRVLVREGVVLFAEHTRSDHRFMARIQSTLDPVWGWFAGGCHLDRDALGFLQSAGFELEDVQGHGRGPFNLTPVHRGVARKR